MNCLEAINSDIIDKTFDNYIVHIIKPPVVQQAWKMF